MINNNVLWIVLRNWLLININIIIIAYRFGRIIWSLSCRCCCSCSCTWSCRSSSFGINFKCIRRISNWSDNYRNYVVVVEERFAVVFVKKAVVVVGVVL